MVNRIWKQFGRHLDIVLLFVSSIFLAGTAWNNVSASLTDHAARIARLEEDSRTVREATVRIEQKVDDIHDALNIQHRDRK